MNRRNPPVAQFVGRAPALWTNDLRMLTSEDGAGGEAQGGQWHRRRTLLMLRHLRLAGRAISLQLVEQRPRHPVRRGCATVVSDTKRDGWAPQDVQYGSNSPPGRHPALPRVMRVGGVQNVVAFDTDENGGEVLVMKTTDSAASSQEAGQQSGCGTANEPHLELPDRPLKPFKGQNTVVMMEWEKPYMEKCVEALNITHKVGMSAIAAAAAAAVCVCVCVCVTPVAKRVASVTC